MHKAGEGPRQAPTARCNDAMSRASENVAACESGCAKDPSDTRGKATKMKALTELVCLFLCLCACVRVCFSVSVSGSVGLCLSRNRRS